MPQKRIYCTLENNYLRGSSHKNRQRRAHRRKAIYQNDLDKYVTNLSHKELSVQQRKVLALGLKFVPTQRVQKDSQIQSMERFKRNVRLKDFFKDRETTPKHPFKKKINGNLLELAYSWKDT